jgi:hypothetical protein
MHLNWQVLIFVNIFFIFRQEWLSKVRQKLKKVQNGGCPSCQGIATVSVK